MELRELLDSEGLEADELVSWARQRADQLVLALEAAEPADASLALLQLLEADAQIDLAAVHARDFERADEGSDAGEVAAHEADAALPVAAYAERDVEQDAEQAEQDVEYEAAAPAEIDEQNTAVFDLDVGSADADEEPAEDVPLPRRRRGEPSSPQPISADELPPPPEHTGLADGEPEPMLETVDTGPIDLGTPEADALIAATSTRHPEAEAPTPPAEQAQAEDEDEAEEEEFEEFEEIDLEEFDLVEEVEEVEEGATAGPPPPRPPPPPPPPPSARADAASASADDLEGAGMDQILAELRGADPDQAASDELLSQTEELSQPEPHQDPNLAWQALAGESGPRGSQDTSANMLTSALSEPNLDDSPSEAPESDDGAESDDAGPLDPPDESGTFDIDLD